jgi:hypothetical protein
MDTKKACTAGNWKWYYYAVTNPHRRDFAAGFLDNTHELMAHD